MIIEREPISMTESLKYIAEKKDSEADVKKFIKKFIKLKPEKAKELREKLSSLEMLKLKPEHHELLDKVLDAVARKKMALDEDEAKKILDIVGEFR